MSPVIAKIKTFRPLVLYLDLFLIFLSFYNIYYSHENDLYYWFYFSLLLAGCLQLRYVFDQANRIIQVLCFNGVLLILIFICFEFIYRTLLIPAPTYSFTTAKGNPNAYDAWAKLFSDEWTKLHPIIDRKDPDKFFPQILIPNRTGKIFDALVKINSYGFRGEEFKIEKEPDKFRIVAIGESTTFGTSVMTKDGMPWPLVLEAKLNQNVHGHIKFEILNAGVFAYDIRHNIRVLREKVLALKPDMIIMYTGINNFHLMTEATPPQYTDLAPVFHHRPSLLLADGELFVAYKKYLYSIRKYRMSLANPNQNPIKLDTLKKLFSEFVDIVESNNIPLMLTSFNFVVNPTSPEEVYKFYGNTIPDLHANVYHNVIFNNFLREFARSKSLQYIDTSRDLDGDYLNDKYIDRVHFTQKGEDQLASNIYGDLRGILSNKFGFSFKQ